MSRPCSPTHRPVRGRRRWSVRAVSVPSSTPSRPSAGALLEEAAGITGLHARRHEAELRLRAAETNLERLEDVVGALEEQHRLLKRQARQATATATFPTT